jgi:hypothetical protein
MHGVISYLVHTQKPTKNEIEWYQSDLLQAVELMENVPREPYSMKFADTKVAAHAACSIMALQVNVPLSMIANNHASEGK